MNSPLDLLSRFLHLPMDFCFSVCVSPSTEKSSAFGLRGTCTTCVLFSCFLRASVYSEIFSDSESFSEYRTWNFTTNVLVILVGKEKKIKAILRSRVSRLLSSSEKSSRILTCSFQIQRDPCHVKLTAFCLARQKNVSREFLFTRRTDVVVNPPRSWRRFDRCLATVD